MNLALADAGSSGKFALQDMLFGMQEQKELFGRNSRFEGIDVSKKKKYIEVVETQLFPKARDRNEIDTL